MLQPLSGRAVIVTGGGTGLGHACASVLAQSGAIVTICGRTEATLQASAARIAAQISGEGAIQYGVGDAADEADMREIVRIATARTGRLDGCIANAGGGGMPGATHQQSVDEFTRILRVNLVATMVTVKCAMEPMRKAGGGSLVFISSLNGDSRVAANYTSAYSAAKAGIDQLMRVAACEYGKDRIRVNSIRPGYIHTEINDQHVGKGTGFYQSCRDNVLLDGPLGQPEDIAHLARFLIGPESRWITGQAFSVDGGQSLNRGPDSTSLMQALGLAL